MRVVADIENDPDSLARSLEGQIAISQKQWREHPEWKPLYETRIRYQRQPPPEKFQSSEETRKRGRGDCDQLTVDQVAYLRERCGEFGAVPWVYQTGPTTWHAIVRRGDGTFEDPSKIQKRREAKGWPSMSVNGDDDDAMNKAIVDVQTLTDGSKVGVVQWETETAHVTIKIKGDGPTHAAERATAYARKMLANPLIRSIAPPQINLALNAADKLIGLAKSGQLQKYGGKIKGPALKLARKLF